MNVSKVYDIVQIEYANTSNKKIPLEYFIIPYKNNKNILYFPLKGIIALVNQNFLSKIETNDIIVKKMFGYAKKQPTVEPTLDDTKEVVIELTTACNLKCIYCYANGGDKCKYIDWKTAKAAIDYQISKCKDDKFMIKFHGGGEPLLAFPMMKKCYKYAKKKCDTHGIILRTGLATNGTLVTEKIVKWIKKVNMRVLLSFDGLPQMQNLQRPFRDGNPSYNSVIKAIKLFNKYKIRYYTQAIVTEYSINKMNDIIKNLHKLGVKECCFGNIMKLGRCSKSNLKTTLNKNYDNRLKKTIKFAKTYGIICNKEEEQVSVPINTKCVGCGCYMFVVTASGNITSCLTITDPSDPAYKIFCYGKIKNGKVIINKRKLKYLRNMNLDKMERCNKCFAKYICRGGCPAIAIRNRKSSFKLTEQECIKKKAEAIAILINELKT